MPSNQTPDGQRHRTDLESTSTMTIGELSEITGLSTSAIRFYQRRGLLPARDTDGGWQRYGREALDRLAVIELAKSAGFSLDEVVRILDALDTDPDTVPATAPIWHGLAEVKLADIDAKVRRLHLMRQLLQDALAYSYLSPDRARQVPAAIGWVAEQPEPSATLQNAVQIPHSTRDLDVLTDGGDRHATPQA